MNYNQIILDAINVAINGKTLLQNITLQIPRGQITSIVGASGSGKTTFLKLILDLLFVEKGWQIAGEAIRFPGLKMAYINQNPALQVFKNFVHEEFSTLGKKDVAQLLANNGCLNLFEKRCLELSQGEKTLIAVLRALSLNVDLLAFDEVMVNLSPARREWLTKTIIAFKAAGGTILLADHNAKIIDFADSILFVDAGRIAPISKTQASSLFMEPGNIIVEKQFTRDSSANVILELQERYSQQSGIPARRRGSELGECSSSYMTQASDDANNAGNLSAKSITDSLIARSNSKPLCFTATSGEIVGICGENGSGKSSLLEIIAGIKKIEQGTVLWNGDALKGLRSRKKIVTFCSVGSTQQFLTNKVQHELELATFDINCATSQEIIEVFNLRCLIEHNIDSLSYGQKQKLALAIAMLSDAPLLLFDEPTYGMDKAALQEFVKGLHYLAARGKIIIMASHEVPLLNSLSTKIINL